MKTAAKILALLAILGMVNAVMAKDVARFQEVRGTVTRNEGGIITVSVDQKGVATEVLVTTSEKTIVQIPKVKDATVKDIAVGMTIDARIADGVAVWIDAKEAKAPKAPKGDGEAPKAPKTPKGDGEAPKAPKGDGAATKAPKGDDAAAPK